MTLSYLGKATIHLYAQLHIKKKRHFNLLLFPAWQPKQLDSIKRLESCENYILKEKISNCLSLVNCGSQKTQP